MPARVVQVLAAGIILQLRSEIASGNCPRPAARRLRYIAPRCSRQSAQNAAPIIAAVMINATRNMAMFLSPCLPRTSCSCLEACVSAALRRVRILLSDRSSIGAEPIIHIPFILGCAIDHTPNSYIQYK
eukprot:TRINITY_DN8040_c0_g2_i1.p1 TRINITY_DN8040_c0_g2~~TRINITY_DN8040_c0_g2_i1.p1  ORF type:complete len:129 (-),score=2.46 TRINITY_DN8040_c0_g2_i1:40-426(-)